MCRPVTSAPTGNGTVVGRVDAYARCWWLVRATTPGARCTCSPRDQIHALDRATFAAATTRTDWLACGTHGCGRRSSPGFDPIAGRGVKPPIIRGTVTRTTARAWGRYSRWNYGRASRVVRSPGTQGTTGEETDGANLLRTGDQSTGHHGTGSTSREPAPQMVKRR